MFTKADGNGGEKARATAVSVCFEESPIGFLIQQSSSRTQTQGAKMIAKLLGFENNVTSLEPSTEPTHDLK